MSGLLTDLAKEVVVVLVADVGRTVFARFLEAPNSSTTSTYALVNADEDSDDETAAAGGVELKAKDVAMRVGMAAGLSLLHWGTTKLLFGSSSSSSSSEPLMKAPGKPPIKINRRDFEANPAGYFRQARAEKKLAKQLINGFSTTTK